MRHRATPIGDSDGDGTAFTESVVRGVSANLCGVSIKLIGLSQRHSGSQGDADVRACYRGENAGYRGRRGRPINPIRTACSKRTSCQRVSSTLRSPENFPPRCGEARIQPEGQGEPVRGFGVGAYLGSMVSPFEA